MHYRKRLLLFAVSVLVIGILSSPAHAAFKGNLADVQLTLTPEDYSIANRDNESMYALLRFQIKEVKNNL